jgi:hypothetical protein
MLRYDLERGAFTPCGHRDVWCATTPSAIQAIVDIAKPLGIAVLDRIIVGKEGHASLKGLKLI